MVSIMSDREIDRKSASSNISFSGIDSRPEEGGSPRRSPLMDDFDKARVLDLDLEDGDSENSRMVLSGSSEPPSVGVRVSESEAWRAVEGSGSGSMSRSRSRASHQAAPRWMNGLKVGDMVWGKVKSHPWWPGHIFNEAFASPSVRRSRREGHALVAFFGDSSYGWFDPAELIPFEPHFAEKSSQTNSRTFVKAVEEAVDEVSRRGALPLACHCRSPNNFRPTAVPGYFSVDVTGFEPGGVYSSEQIENARDSFQPAEALSFVQQLALAPQRNMSGRSVDWIKSMSSLLAYRRAVYEEFDETYAQAFGVQPVRPSKNDSGVPNQPTRAPLSGPLVIAEQLGDKKNSTKFAKAPSTSKKNKYVLKRRDETQTTTPPLPDFRAERKTHDNHYFDLAPGQQPQASAVISSLPAFREAATTAVPSTTSANASQTDNYVLQKRVPAEKMQPVPTMPEDGKAEGQPQKQLITEPVNKAADTDSHDGSYSILQPPTVHPSAMDADLDDWMLKSQQQPQERPIAEGDPKIGAIYTPSDLWQDEKPPATSKQGAIDITQSKLESHSLTGDQPAMGVTPVAFGPQFAKVQNAGAVLDGAVKKEKVRKRFPGDDDTGEVKKKKKKKKKIKHDESSTDRLIETPKDVEHRRKVAGKSEIELQSRQPEAVRAAASLPKMDVIDSTDLELPQLLTDLSALALDPFYGMERSAPDVVRHVFLRFRSMVYQKALVLPPPAGENEVPVVRPTKPAEPKTRTSDVRELKPPSKPISRLDDPTKAGRKRGPSDRQEELSAKRIKKLKLLKALSREKKGGINQKPPEGQPRDPKLAAAAGTTATPAKPSVAPAEPVKKREPPRAPSPTYLVMKFPPRSTLPSVASLKARFARFGTLDLDATRVYWKSHTCKVLFKYKSDAEDACNYGKSNELFGQFKVSYHTRELEEPGKQQKEPGADDGLLQLRPGNGGPLSQPRPLPQQRLKSILKKPGDEAGTPGGGIAKDSQRVKFMLGGGDGSRKEPPAPSPPVAVAHSNYGSGSPFPPSEPVSMNPKSVNFLPSSSPPPQSFPHHRPFYPSSTISQSHHVPDMHQFSPVSPAPASVFQPFHAPDVQWFPPPPPPPPLSQLSQPPPRFIDGFENRGLSPFSEAQPLRIPQNGESEVVKADISRQMLSLLLRCSDIVTSVKSSFGYVPYRPL